jgi:hypothetical protein
MAEEWIASHRSAFEDGRQVSLAVTLRKHGALIGCITLDLERTRRERRARLLDRRAVLGTGVRHGSRQ